MTCEASVNSMSENGGVVQYVTVGGVYTLWSTVERVKRDIF